VTPFALWTHVLLKGGEAMLDSMQNAVRRSARPAVGVIPTEDAPKPAARQSPRKPRAKAKAKATPKRKVRARSAKARRR
jgi:hypothetical protein